jgi:hypothetical protein
MVVGEKSYKHIDEGPIRSRRTRSPTAAAGDNASDDEDVNLRVGPEYQASIPDFVPNAKPETKSEAMLVWAAHQDPEIDKKIDAYATIAKEKHGYNMEQALGMLFWHKHNFEKALADLPNFTPFPDEWTVEDKVLFEQAFNFHGKSFNRIRQMLPDKSVASLVKYYYSWKKTRSRTSLIDRQAHKITSSQDISDDDDSASSGSEDGTKGDHAKDQKDEPIQSTVRRGGLISPRKVDTHARLRSKRKPPRGMFINKDSLMAFASGLPGHGETLLKKYEAELVELKRQVQNNKQLLSAFKEQTTEGIVTFRISEGTQKLNGKWTNDELLLAVQGVRRYGKNYRAIAEVIGNKNESLVRSFFVTYRRRFKLDEVLAEYEKEHGSGQDTKEPQRDEVPMEEDGAVVQPVAAVASSSASECKMPTATPASQPPTLSVATVTAGTAATPIQTAG